MHFLDFAELNVKHNRKNAFSVPENTKISFNAKYNNSIRFGRKIKDVLQCYLA